MAKILTRARSHAVEYRADAGEQFAQAERLGETIVGAEFQPDHSVDLVAAVASRDDDRNVRARPYVAKQVEPVILA